MGLFSKSHIVDSSEASQTSSPSLWTRLVRAVVARLFGDVIDDQQSVEERERAMFDKYNT